MSHVGGSSHAEKASSFHRETRFIINMVAEHGWSPERGARERIADVYVPQVVKRTIKVPKTAEQILDVLVPEMVEQKLPETVSDDRIQQRTAEHIAVIPVPQVVEKLVVVSPGQESTAFLRSRQVKLLIFPSLRRLSRACHSDARKDATGREHARSARRQHSRCGGSTLAVD